MISHQIRSEKDRKIKEEGRKITHTYTHMHNFLRISSSFPPLRSQERTLHLILAVWGIAALPEPPFWKHPLEQRVTGESSFEGEGEREREQAEREREIKKNADVYPNEVS